jgi:two-component system, NarL family, nitrate/nitrite response regulator NarL
MTDKIQVAILDDHQGIIDGYHFRLNNVPDIEVVATIGYGEELEPMLAQHPVDLLLLDVSVPISPENRNPYPILFLIPKLLKEYPNLTVLVVTMHAQRTLIKAVLEAGATGYVFKDDQTSIKELPSIIRMMVGGGIHLSQSAYQLAMKSPSSDLDKPLNARQLEALSICAAYPDASTAELAGFMNIEGSTLRNLLSGAYLKLGVRTRAAAIARARQMELITQESPSVDIQKLDSELG